MVMTEKQFDRTVEHLLALHAKAEARADRADVRMDRMDKQLQATANLVRAGIRIVARLVREGKQTNQRLDRLIAALYRTERNGKNGR